MDTRLFDAAQNGNINDLLQFLTENPLSLDSISLLFSENPLHIASNMGHVDFVKEILKSKPEFSKEINQDGFSPMHIAAAKGHVEIVMELMKLDHKLCLVEGKEKRTPLHYASIKGRMEVIIAMLLGCPDCIEEVTVRSETALHLAVQNNQFKATKILVDRIHEMNKEDVLNMKDQQGNTVLHLAAWKKQYQVIELLLGSRNVSSGFLEVNAINHSGLTPLDMLLVSPSEAGDREIIEILLGAGAMKARDITLSSISFNQNPIDTSITTETRQPQPDNLVEYFKFQKCRDSPSEARGTLLVIAVLVATATFQVGVSPPGGVWQDTSIPDQNNSTISNPKHFAGQSILGTTNRVAFALFVLFNTIGFSMSLCMIKILTSRLPLQFELQICFLAMFCTYNTALINITPARLSLFVVLATAILTSTTSIVSKMAKKLPEKIRKFTGNTTCRVLESVMRRASHG